MAANLRRTAALVLGLTLTVNALNYLRDAALAARFGASPASDAIFSALLLPAILQQMLVAGTLAPAVVPVYLEMAGHSPSQARRLTWQVLLSVAVGLIPLAVLAVFLTPALVNLLFPGFDAATQALTAVSYTHLRAHETVLDLVCRLLLATKKFSAHGPTASF